MEQAGNYDCQQIWEFTILLPEEVISEHKSLTGAFFFELELYTCIDLDDAQLNCVTVVEAGVDRKSQRRMDLPSKPRCQLQQVQSSK